MENNVIEGYKVFNPDWTCKRKQYTCPGKFEESGELSICSHGMHFCKEAVDCFNYYAFNPNNKVAKVIAYGDIIENSDKCCTNKLEIVREIPWVELLAIVNMGKGCSGLYNSGDYNSGNHNSGDYNSGLYNSGDYNSGLYNSGDYNSGNHNSGDYNIGLYNSGDYNIGGWNSGDCNSGNHNSGDYNKTNFSNGCFNTIEPKIYLFNKPSKWTYRDWFYSDARCFLSQIPRDKLAYVRFSDMTDEEKKKHPESEVAGGFLKMIKTTNAQRQMWWDNLSHDNKKIIKNIPNFDKEIFKEITGIDVGQ